MAKPQYGRKLIWLAKEIAQQKGMNTQNKNHKIFP
jgi:hypothetical protein